MIGYLKILPNAHLEAPVAEEGAEDAEHEVEGADGGGDHVVVGGLEEGRRNGTVLCRRIRRNDRRKESVQRIFVVIRCHAGQVGRLLVPVAGALVVGRHLDES